MRHKSVTNDNSVASSVLSRGLSSIQASAANRLLSRTREVAGTFSELRQPSHSIPMGQRIQQLYVEGSFGADIAALVQALEGLGVSVVKSPPPIAKPCYVIVDIGRRMEQVNNWIDAWYEARAELNVRATFIGLVTDRDATPVPGVCQIKAWNAVLGVLEALALPPRAISPETLQHQRQSSRQRQANRLIHDLRTLVELSVLSPEVARGTLMAAWNQVTHYDLKSLLENLIDEVMKTQSSVRLRDILKRQLTTLEDER